MAEAVLDSIKVSVKNGKSCEKILTIEVGQDAVQKEFEAFYQEVAPKAKIPGFRPGKAPRNVLEIHFGEEARSHVLKHLISESFREALTQAAVDPLMHPKIQDIDFNQNKLVYKATVEVRPKIKLSRVKGLTAKKDAAEVKTEELDAEIQRIRESLAQFKAVEDRPAQTNDFVVVDYVCTVEGKEVDKRTDDWLEMREDAFLKELTAQLIGAKPGEEKTVSVTLPDTLGRKELAGKPAIFQVKVKEIKTKLLPELNDDLAKEAGDFSTLADLKEKIRKDLLARKQRETEVAFENALLEELVKHNKVDLPQGLVERRLESLLEEAKRGFLNQGADEAEFEKQKEKLTSGLESEAKRQVHLAFLLDEISVQENFKAEDADIFQRYEEMAVRVKQPVEKIKKFYEENESMRYSIAEQIRNEKAINFIKQNAKAKR